MAGGQRTFTHVPTSLVRSNRQQRPMTSKAAKKAYQQANRGPRISRAEQHRRDKAELEQQKREYEREKAAERAKVAREKKAAKAAAEKEARRKQGIPEPSKFVRPSQPTISRFVWNNSTSKRTSQQMESVAEDSDKTISDAEKDDEGPPAKRRAVDEGSDNEYGDFPSLSQSDLLEQIDSSIFSAKDGTSAPASPKKKPPSSQPRRREASQELPIMKEVDEHSILNTQALDELATTQLLSDLAEAVAKSDSMEPPNTRLSQIGKETSEVAPKAPVSPRRSGRVAGRAERAVDVSGRRKRDTVPVVEIPYKSAETILSQTESSPKSNRPKSQALLPVPPLQSRPVNMPPPRLSIKTTAAIKSIYTPQRPSLPSWNPLNHVPKPVPNLPPSSTQAFLENHMDDFFPSPTQAVRELLEDVDDIPSNTKVARELSPKKAEEVVFENMFCTQDMIMSPEDLVEIISPDRSPPKPLVEATSESLNRRDNTLVGRKPSPKKSEQHVLDDMFCSQDLMSREDLVDVFSPQATAPEALVEAISNCLNRRESTHINGEFAPGETKENDRDDFIGTQDLILSPEDLEEICSPVRAPSPAGAKLPISPPPRPSCRQKQRFFQEKEEDLYHAAIHKSKATSAQGTNIPKNDSTSLGRNQSDSTDYGEFDFDLPGLFKEKEDEELEAAIRESKITAELEAKRLATAGMPCLNRIQSNSTDYGDLELPCLFDEHDEDVNNSRAEAKAQLPKQSDETAANNAKAKPRRFFEEKYEDQVHAAIHESKMLAAKKVPLKQDTSTGTEKPKRTLKRVLSTATDYGDDDFMGCSQELLDLC
ncbi:hypothetical protein DL98DRAFT_528578 [Cadophora sp. DSE1049]|nr:hypothetical protein DL98DRAFT_528578 [Cadophora sp. DSE1049]